LAPTVGRTASKINLHAERLCQFIAILSHCRSLYDFSPLIDVYNVPIRLIFEQGDCHHSVGVSLLGSFLISTGDNGNNEQITFSFLLELPYPGRWPK
jgi:hypothetical protein